MIAVDVQFLSQPTLHKSRGRKNSRKELIPAQKALLNESEAQT